MRKLIQPCAASARMQASTKGKPGTPFAPSCQPVGIRHIGTQAVIGAVEVLELDARFVLQLLHEMAMPMLPPGERDRSKRASCARAASSSPPQALQPRPCSPAPLRASPACPSEVRRKAGAGVERGDRAQTCESGNRARACSGKLKRGEARCATAALALRAAIGRKARIARGADVASANRPASADGRGRLRSAARPSRGPTPAPSRCGWRAGRITPNCGSSFHGTPAARAQAFTARSRAYVQPLPVS